MRGLEARAQVEIAAPPLRVWQALTDPDQVAQYMSGSLVETDWKPGSPITWSGKWAGRAYRDKGVVLAAEPGSILDLTHYSPITGDEDVPENYHTLHYRLTETEHGTELSLTQDGCESKEQAAQFSKNWQGMLDGLKAVAEAG